MRIIGKLVSRLGISKELMLFLWQRKLWWLIPLIIFLIFFSILLVFGGTGVAPFIYTIF